MYYHSHLILTSFNSTKEVNLTETDNIVLRKGVGGIRRRGTKRRGSKANYLSQGGWFSSGGKVMG